MAPGGFCESRQDLAAFFVGFTMKKLFRAALTVPEHLEYNTSSKLPVNPANSAIPRLHYMEDRYDLQRGR